MINMEIDYLISKNIQKKRKKNHKKSQKSLNFMIKKEIK